MSFQNPIAEIQEDLGLVNTDFANLLGVSTLTLAHAKRGHTANPKSVLLGLAEAGYDGHQIGELYDAWRQRQRLNLLARYR